MASSLADTTTFAPSFMKMRWWFLHNPAERQNKPVAVKIWPPGCNKNNRSLPNTQQALSQTHTHTWVGHFSRIFNLGQCPLTCRWKQAEYAIVQTIANKIQSNEQCWPPPVMNGAETKILNGDKFCKNKEAPLSLSASDTFHQRECVTLSIKGCL